MRKPFFVSRGIALARGEKTAFAEGSALTVGTALTGPDRRTIIPTLSYTAPVTPRRRFFWGGYSVRSSLQKAGNVMLQMLQPLILLE